MRIRPAIRDLDHERIMVIAKRSPYTSDYGHMMFSGGVAYAKGWIRVCESIELKLLGFTCVRHKKREPATNLYFIGVALSDRRTGIADRLLADLRENSPHRRIILNVAKDNKAAIAFYTKHRFMVEGESLKGKGFKLSLEW